jgi:hypothetical protein
MSEELSVREIGQRIYFIRGHRVMLDSNLAELYEVESDPRKARSRKSLNQISFRELFT